MGKKILLVLIALLFILSNLNCMGVCAEEKFTALNDLLDVGNKVYVQHDENNKNVYDLKKSETGLTTVYETILVDFTAGKAWTVKGEFIDAAFGATAPEKFIPVKCGEKYFIKTYGVGWAGEICYAPVLFLDDNDTIISDVLTNTLSASKNGVVIEVPQNATKMHLTMYNNQNFALQKVLNLTNEEFDNLPINRTRFENTISEMYERYKNDKTVYKKLDKAYITFVNDDSRASVSEYADLFISKDVPLVLATIPEALIENAYNKQETRLEVARRVEQAGGEIIAHNGGVLTQEGLADYNTMYSFFVKTKQLFNYYNFDVNGIILAGGVGQVCGAQESEKWVSSIYSYSDLYGVEYDKKEIALDSVYYHRRGGLGNFESDLYKIKQEIDNAITNKSWLVFYFHDSSEIDTEVLGKVLDYVNSKNGTELEAVTYKEMYQRNAVKESKIINTNHTYYVSSAGTSTNGTDINKPMSYEAAKRKVYISGDTILLKKGDTFYGTFEPNIVQLNDKITTISSYGEGEMPNIVGYKVVNSEEAWKLHTEGIYKVNLIDTQSFSGLMTISGNSTNIGFLEDKNGKKYFNKKSTLSGLKSEYDFYCDKEYLYMKIDENPYNKVGELKLATKTNLFILQSNLKIQNIKFSGTGAHGLVNSNASIKNLEISNNIIQDIGGSYLKGTTRYGNGIELYGADAADVKIQDNIIRNVYDVGFTIQGNRGSGKEIVVKNNVFVANSQDSEIWENGSATGIESYEFTNNISVNAGRGWGYNARPDKYDAAHILFWGYLIENTNIYFHHNAVYNPRRVYFIEETYGTNIFFKEKDCIRSDYNTYILAKDATIFRESYKISEKDTFISEYKKDMNSTFLSKEINESMIEASLKSNDIGAIKEMIKSELNLPEQPTTPEQPTVTAMPTITASPTVTIVPTVLPSPTATIMPTITESPTVTVVPTAFPSPTATIVPTVLPSPTVTIMPTITESPTVTVVPTVLPSPTVIPSIAVTQQPTMTITPTVSIPVKGTKLTDTKTKAVYSVTKAGKTEGTVTYTKPVSKNITSVSIPRTVTIDGITYKVNKIAPYAFKNCKKLTKVTIKSNIVSIGNSSFSGCKKLKTVNMGTNVTTIGTNAFYKCTALKKITIPSKTTKIGKQAFFGCKGLKNITVKSTKLTAKNVGSKAFKGIYSKATIKVPKNKVKAYKKLWKAKGAGSKVEVKKF